MLRFLFDYATDRYGDFYPARLLPDIAWAILWLAVFVCAIHAVRRARNNPMLPRRANYNLNQRLYHWANFALLAVLAISGFYLFFRRPPPSPLEEALRMSWLDIHQWFGVLFAVGVGFHAVAALVRGEPDSMRPRGSDFSQLVLMAKNFLGRTDQYPTPGKYDAIQKLCHTLLAMLAVAFIFSGGLLWLSNSRRWLVSRGWLHWSRLVHDLAAVVLVALVIAHIYFSLLKVKRDNLRDMLGLATHHE